MENSLVRKSDDNRKKYAADGVYQGYLEKAEKLIVNSAFTDTGKKETIVFTAIIKNRDGEEVELPFFNNLTWSKYGNLHKTLVELDRLPKEGEIFDLTSVEGIAVEVTVENNEKNGIVYSNIVELKKISDPQPKKSAREITVADLEGLLDEDDKTTEEVNNVTSNVERHGISMEQLDEILDNNFKDVSKNEEY